MAEEGVGAAGGEAVLVLGIARLQGFNFPLFAPADGFIDAIGFFGHEIAGFVIRAGAAAETITLSTGVTARMWVAEDE